MSSIRLAPKHSQGQSTIFERTISETVAPGNESISLLQLNTLKAAGEIRKPGRERVARQEDLTPRGFNE